MVSSKHGARISESDIADLDSASTSLAAVADQVKRANPSWAATTIQLLIAANDVIVRLRDRGATTFARYLEKRGLQKPHGVPDTTAGSEDANRERQVAPGQPEEP